jgi:four helix bundle protein
MHHLKGIKVWQKSIELATDIYAVTKNFPVEEKYGLVSQMRRAVVSVSSNISEGAGRNSNKDFIHFLGMANGSSYELQTQIVISRKLNYLSEDEVKSLLIKLEEIQKMTYSFMQKLKIS